MIKRILFVLIAVATTTQLSAQDLLSPTFTYSHKKTSYITLKDGTEVTGMIKDLDRKKGLIEEIKIENEEGKKIKLKPEDVAHMYLPQSGLDKLSQVMDVMGDAQKWSNNDLDQKRLNEGYVYFENANVQIKKNKEMELLMQLLNPTFSKEVKVYHDPMAKQTASIGVAGITVAGGLEKSYFMLPSNKEVAYKLQKKNYDEEYAALWAGCEKLMAADADKKWSNLSKHVLSFSECAE